MGSMVQEKYAVLVLLPLSRVEDDGGALASLRQVRTPPVPMPRAVETGDTRPSPFSLSVSLRPPSARLQGSSHAVVNVVTLHIRTSGSHSQQPQKNFCGDVNTSAVRLNTSAVRLCKNSVVARSPLPSFQLRQSLSPSRSFSLSLFDRRTLLFITKFATRELNV